MFLFLILIKKNFIIASNQPQMYKMHCRKLIKRNYSEYLSVKSVTADNISKKTAKKTVFLLNSFKKRESER